MNVVFLDYDGVVNTPMWDEEGKHCRFNFPEDNKVNNFQSVQWVSEFCEQYGYGIVVSSTWRFDDNYIECLVNGGLRSGIEIVGKTPIIKDGTRGDEIEAYLMGHPEVEFFLIFDDENDVELYDDHLVLCDTDRGFGLAEYYEAGSMHDEMRRKKLYGSIFSSEEKCEVNDD